MRVPAFVLFHANNLDRGNRHRAGWHPSGGMGLRDRDVDTSRTTNPQLFDDVLEKRRQVHGQAGFGFSGGQDFSLYSGSFWGRVLNVSVAASLGPKPGIAKAKCLDLLGC